MANQYSNGAVRVCDMVADYVEQHPRTTARQIAESMGMSVPRISQELWTLQQEGRVSGAPIPGSGKARAWSITDAGMCSYDQGQVVIRVKEWTGHARDEWTALFFGAAA